MHILIIGYGNIGKIKAPIWRSLGADVRIFDTDPKRQQEIIRDGYRPYQHNQTDIIELVDISTPAGSHYRALLWCLAQPNIRPKRIAIEKPLASSREELVAFERLISQQPSLREVAFVNESYYQSTVVKHVKQQIHGRHEVISSVSIELSKNRLADNDQGRFFDATLDAIGIEVPHMLAILDSLSIDLDFARVGEGLLEIDETRNDNQAYTFVSHDTPQVRLASYLGDFRNHQHAPTGKASVVRTVAVNTSDHEYVINFDPAPGCSRYQGRVTTYRNGRVDDEIILLDDHLRAHMKLLMAKNIPVQEYCIGIERALLFANKLLELRERC